MPTGVVKISTLFILSLATSIVVEVLSWARHLHTSQLYPFVASEMWWVKHLIIAALLTTLLYQVARRYHKELPIIFSTLFLGIVLVFATQYGYEGTWFCDNPCEGVVGLLIPFSFGTSLLFSLVAISLLQLVNYKSPKWVVALMLVVSLLIIGYSVWRPLYQEKILANFPFYTTENLERVLSAQEQGSPQYEFLKSYVINNQSLAQETTATEWAKACHDFDRASLGFQFYGATAATNCYAQGALLFDDSQLCEKLPIGGGAFQNTQEYCRGNLIPILHAATNDKAAPKSIPATVKAPATVRYSGGDGLHQEEGAIIIQGVTTEEQIAQAEKAYIANHHPTGSLLRIDRIPGNISGPNGSKDYVMDVAIIQTPRDTFDLWFDVTSLVK